MNNMDCIFCKIVRGEIPCYKVYEDDLFLGFLDIFPLSAGNALLIPKQHHRWVTDVPEFGAYWEAAKKLSMSILQSLNAYSVSFLTLGEEVPHAHIRIIPRYSPEDIYLTLKKTEPVQKEEMVRVQKLVVKKLEGI